MKKIVFLFCALYSIAGHAEEEKKPVIVYVDVVGDLFHSGHVEFFQKARALGDYLIVGVLSDAVVSSYKREPIMDENERARVISGCRYVDMVVEDCPLGVTDELLDKYDIDIVVHGDDFNEEEAREQYLPAIEREIFRLVPNTSGVSTSDIIDRISQRSGESLAKKDFFEGTKAALRETE